MISILIVSYSIIAAIIGAGFASGQEMLLYFVCFKKYGAIGIIVTAASFTYFVYTVLNTCIKRSYHEYDVFLSVFTHTAIKRAIKTVTLIFSFAVYGAMISAAGEMLYDTFAIPRATATLICACFATILLYVCNNRIFTLNAILGVALVILIIFSTLYMLSYREYHTFSPQLPMSLGSALIYSGYNLVSLTPVLVILSKKLKTQSQAVGVALCVGIISLIIMSMIFYLISIYCGKISLGEIPMLTLARRQNPTFAAIYTFVLGSAILTTLISSGGSLCDTLGIKGKLAPISLLSAGGYLLSSLGFSRLIDTAYRFCGIAGLLICIIISVGCLRQNKHS